MATKYEVIKAYKMNDNGMDVCDGWDLMVNGNWGNRYALKRDAVAAMKEAIAEDSAAK